MADSSVSYTGVAAQQAYTITFNFLKQSHVKCVVDGVTATFTISGSTLTISTPTIAGGETIFIYRDTPRTVSGLLVDFTDGSTLSETDLDNSVKQQLFVAQEALERSLREQLDGDGHFTAGSKLIEDVLDPVKSQDVVTKAYADALTIAAGSLPTVSGADNDGFLSVVSGAWALQTLAETKTRLSLPTDAAGDITTLQDEADNARGLMYVSIDDAGLVISTASLGAPTKRSIGITTVEAADADNAMSVDDANDEFDLEPGTYEFTAMLMVESASAITAQIECGFTDTAPAFLSPSTGVPSTLLDLDDAQIVTIPLTAIVTVGSTSSYQFHARRIGGSGDITVRSGYISIRRLA